MAGQIPIYFQCKYGHLPSARLQLFSTVSSFFGATDTFAQSAKSRKFLSDRLTRLLSMWRDAADRVSKCGWKHGVHLTDRVFLSNCRPTGAEVVSAKRNRLKLWPCNRANFCPWCWARRASGSFERIERIAFPEPSAMRQACEVIADGSGEPVPGVMAAALETLAERCHRFDFALRTEFRNHLIYEGHQQPSGTEPLGQWLGRRTAQYRSKKFTKVFKNPEAAIEFTVVTHDAVYYAPNVQFRQLFLYPTGTVPEILTGAQRPGAEVEIAPTPTRDEIIKLLAKVFRYPAQYLTTNPPEATADILNTISNYRLQMLASFGALSRSGSRSRGAQSADTDS